MSKETEIKHEQIVLREKLTSRGISTVAFDLDGTILNTRVVFNNAIMDALTAMGKTGEEASLIKDKYFDPIIWALRPEMGINPAIMEASTIIMAKILGLEESHPRTQTALNRVRRIYTHDVSELFSGALQAIETIDGAVSLSILATHAQEDWTFIKRCGAGLLGKFAQVVCFSIDRDKSAQWEQLRNRLDIKPSSLLVIGDNFTADIAEPVLRGGWGVYIEGGKFGQFGKDNQVETGPVMATGRVAVVKNIAGVVPKLLSLDKDDWRN